MEIITTETISGRVRVPVYHYTEIPYTQIMLEAKESKKPGRGSGVAYLEIPCAFDIETTNIYERIRSGKNKGKINSEKRPFAFMYHWQFCIGFRVIFGRTWDEFRKCLSSIIKNMNLSNKLRLVVYVHNLSFEMQFMRRFIRVTDSFCKSDRNPLKVVHDDCIEFRCSAAISNMSLQMFCKNENAQFYKMVDEYDYSKIRTSETELTETEKGYCYNDVRGLCECIQSLMRFDTLATIPLTSTGYVRRDARTAMRQNKANRRIFKDSALSAEEYRYMRAAFRGGDTHANLRYANQVLKDVTSFDIVSSYPACMVINTFPMTKFIPIKRTTFDRLRKEKGKYHFLLHVALRKIFCTAEHGIPYIPLAKTKHCTADRIIDNGRIKSASELTIWVTDLDMDIITSEYHIGDIRIGKIYCAKADRLPEEYRNVIMEYYRQKTALKGLKDAESVYLYNKSKNKVNAGFGMMCMGIDKPLVQYVDGKYKEIIKKKIRKQLVNEYDYDDDMLDTLYPKDRELRELVQALIIQDYYNSRNSFLAYQWGVWVCAWARFRLHQMMALIGRDLCYVDTDSCKFLHYDNHKDQIDELNARLLQEAEAAGAYADDKNGNRHFMGVFEYDGHYDQMKTLGAKKYVVNIGGECLSTIAGVSKKAGQEYFSKHGIEAFAIGAVIENSGHLVAYYNDDEIHNITIQGVTMETASNLALIDDRYTIGVTDDYMNLLRNIVRNEYDMV